MSARTDIAPLLLSLIAAGGLASGCTKAGRSIVQVHVTADPTVGALDTVQLSAVQGAQLVRDATSFDWTTGGISVGLYLPSDVSGDVQIIGEGFSGMLRLARSSDSSGHVTVTAGQNTDVVSLVLLPIPASPDGGNTGSGGTGAGGAGAGGHGGADAGTGAGGNGAGGAGTGGNGTGGNGTGGNGTGGNGAGGSSADGGTDAGLGGSTGRSWSVAEMVENDRTDMDRFPAAAMNASGNGVVAWQRGSAIWARSYDGATRTWGTAVNVGPTANFGNLDVGIDRNGIATLVWAGVSGDPASQGIWASRSDSTRTTWSTPAHVSTAANAFLPTVAVGQGADGTVLMAWTENPGNNLFTTRSAAFTVAAGTWGAVNTPMSGVDANDRNPRVAIDGTGKGFLIWESPPTTVGVPSIWVQTYNAGWSAASVTPLSMHTTGDAYSSSIALNETGAGTAIWLHTGASSAELWARRYNAGAWGTQELLATGSFEFDPVPEVAIDPNGTSVAVWSQALPTNYNARASRHVAGATTWEAPQSLETDNLVGNSTSQYVGPVVGMDSAGNAIAVWRKQLATGRTVVYSSRLVPGSTAWTPTNGMALHDDGMHAAFVTDLAVSRDGTALATWYYGTEFDIWASIYR